MKKHFILLSIMFTTLVMAQVSRDNNVSKAATFLREEKWEQVISVLQKENRNDSEVLFFLTVAEFKILQENQNNDFYAVNKVREYALQYIKKYSAKKPEWTRTIQEISSALDVMNPAKSIDEHIANEKKKEIIRIENLKKDRLNVLEKNLSSENYYELKSNLHSFEKDNLLEPYQLDFYKARADYEILKRNNSYELSDVQFVKKQLTSYLTNYSTSNRSYITSIQDALSNMNTDFAQTQEELIKKRAELTKKLYEQKLKVQFEGIKQDYQSNNYNAVIKKSNLFPSDSEFYEEVSYYYAVAQYSAFEEKHTKQFNDIALLRNILQVFVSNKKFTNSNFRKEIEGRLSHINNSFPKTEQEFNSEKARTLKKIEDEREEQRRNQAREIRKMQRNLHRKSFFAIGYEGGLIAPYGLRIEYGGNSFIGFHANVRTTLAKEDQVADGSLVENKNEFILGPNFRISNWLFLNVGGGYGYHFQRKFNDYTGLHYADQKEYLAAYAGATLRLGNRFNLIGGASFIDVDKEFYAPEYTAGITINLN